MEEGETFATRQLSSFFIFIIGSRAGASVAPRPAGSLIEPAIPRPTNSVAAPRPGRPAWSKRSPIGGLHGRDPKKCTIAPSRRFSGVHSSRLHYRSITVLLITSCYRLVH